jgi:hypothetical protein
MLPRDVTIVRNRLNQARLAVESALSMIDSSLIRAAGAVDDLPIDARAIETYINATDSALTSAMNILIRELNR